MTRKKRPSPPRRHNPPVRLNADERQLLRSKLESLLPIVEMLGAEDVRLTAMTIISTLSAPGPLERRQVLPLMTTFEQRMEGLFRRGSQETTGELQEQMKSGIEKTQEGQAFYAERLAEEGAPEPD